MKIKNSMLKRILSLIMVFAMVISLAPPVPVNAATITGGTKLYLKPNDWASDSAWFAAYFCNGTSSAEWVKMTDADGDGIYEVTVPAGRSHKNVIFCRMNSASQTLDWSNRWNQTGDLTRDGNNNLYTITGWGANDGTWSVVTSKSVTIHFQKPDNWSTVKAYAWNGDTNAGHYTDAWPGSVAAKNTNNNGWHTIQLSNLICTKLGIQFNDGSNSNQIEKTFSSIANGGEYWLYADGTGTSTRPANWNKVTVKFNSNGGDSVEEQTVTIGDKVTEPDDPTRTGFTFDGWFKDEEFQDPYDFENDTVTGPLTLYAKWTAETYDVTFVKENVNIEGTAKAIYGQPYTVTVTVTDSTAYKLPTYAEVQIGEQSSSYEIGPNGQFTILGTDIIGNIQISAAAVELDSFELLWKLSHITVKSDVEPVREGADYTATLTAAPGYSLPETITVTMENNQAPNYEYNQTTGKLIVRNVTGNLTIEADGDAIPYEVKVEVEPADGGTVTVDESKATAIVGENVVLTVTPATGYELGSLKYNDNPITAVEGVYSFQMPAGNVEVTATFKKITYSITTALENITSSNTVESVEYGSGEYETNLSIRDWSDGPYRLPDSVMVTMGGNTLVVGTDYTYNSINGQLTIHSVTGDVVITAAAVKLYNIAHNNDANEGKGSLGINGAAAEGEAVIVQVDPREGYKLESLKVMNGTEEVETTKLENGNYSFVMPGAEVTVTATFVKTTMTVYFRNDWNWTNVSIYYWNEDKTIENEWPGEAMTKVGLGAYEDKGATYDRDVYAATIPAEVTGIIFTGKEGEQGKQSPDITTNIQDGKGYYMFWDGKDNVKDDFVFDPNYQGTPGGDQTSKYYVAGTSSLCGSNWSSNDENNMMSYNSDTGLYEKTYTNIAAGTHEFKVTDGTFDRTWPSNNWVLNLDAASDVTITFKAEDGTINVSTVPASGGDQTNVDYYLVGTINGANYGCDEDAANMGEYKFVDGKLTVTFTAGSYVFIKTTNNANWYMTEGWLGTEVTSATLYNTNIGLAEPNKLFVPENVEVTFTLTEGENDTLILSYETAEPDTSDYVSYQATFHFANTLNWGAVYLYTWPVGAESSNAWPGVAVNTDATGYNTKTITYAAAENQGLNFIFNNGSGAQTADLLVDASSFVLDGTDNTYKAEKWVVLTTQTDGKYNAAIVDSPEAIVNSPVIDGSSVTFNYGDKNATNVQIAGSFNIDSEGKWVMTDMAKNANDVWSYTATGLEPGAYQYKFIVDGNWIIDPMNGNVVTDSDGNQNSAFYVLSDNTVDDDNKVTIKIHYTRTDGNYDGWNLWVWGSALDGHRVNFETTESGEKVATIVLPNARDHQYVSFKERLSVEGNEWKEQAGSDRTIDLSTVVSGTIHYYIPDCTVKYGEDVIRKNKLSSVELDYDNNAIVVTAVQAIADAENVLKLVKGEEKINVTVSAVGSKYTLSLPQDQELDLAELYLYKVDYYGDKFSIAIDAAYASDKFAEKYTYDGNDLGATWTSDKTTFRVWAPTAIGVSVNLYSSGTGDTDDRIGEPIAMTAGDNGTWYAVVEGNLNGTYYTYSVAVNGKTVEACDPYARTTGVNGDRAMVIDLDSTDPNGWGNHKDSNPNPVTSQTDAIIYELHVRDFSIDDSSGVKEVWRGKYLAFTQKGTKTPGGATTGIEYLQSLGFTHLHLLPVYDYASVDETGSNSNKLQNWGYDPQNYNVPEGSYSTDPYNGKVRVAEFKQMVQALHEADISVVMDVVYNHVYNASTFSMNQIVPGYFSRVNSNTSGCGNDTASEREMVRKYIVDSVLYWHQEYHIDGFRFDLVGLLDVETINEIVETVHACCPEVIFYGEGWDMDSTNKEPGTQMAKQGNASKTDGFAYFSDSMRNGIAGSNGSSRGFVSGAGNGSAMVSEWMSNPWWSRNPEQVIQYASCHDNYTLIDKLILSTGRSVIDDDVIKMNNLAAAFYMTAQGVPFIHAGEEFLREKLYENGKREENSYNKGDYVNHIEWSNLDKADYAVNTEYYKGLIEFRKAHPALRYASSAEIKNYVASRGVSGSLLTFRVDGSGCNDDDIFVIFNANNSTQTVNLPAGEWTVYVNATQAGTTARGTETGTVSVPAISAMVLTKADEGKDEKEPLGPSEEKTIYFSNNKHWEKVYAYAWTDNGTKVLLGDEWPGVEMTYVETNEYNEKIFSVTLPASDTGVEGVIFSNGGETEQTVDVVPGNDGTGYYCTNKTDGKYEVGRYTYKLGNANEYFLIGYINGVEYSSNDYKIGSDGTIKVTFSNDSYVYVVNGTQSEVYMTDGYKGAVNSATLYNTAKYQLTADKWDKLLVPGAVEVTIKMVKNSNNTVSLSYEMENVGVEDTSGIQDGVTLHCWNWSFEEIEKNMAVIADMGFTAIQTSPVQPLKEATTDATDTVKGAWWVYYQPVDFVITTGDGNALGTKAELESMIETAHSYGIKVIVDVVANHLGNQTGNNLADAIPEYLRDTAYWHDIARNIADWNSRENMTQYCLDGLPDLNTANSEVQGYVLKFLKECVDIGVDGFRFDMAKSIETPMDDASFASGFWPTVVGGAESYAKEQYNKDLYIYGEVLDNAKIAIGAYTQYMAVTDNEWGNHLRSMIAADNATMVDGYYKSAPASVLVIWAESHDTYTTKDAGQSSIGVSEADINKTWALVAARADAMGLYLARPENLEQALGAASKTGWDNPEVEAVNEFHNAFNGKAEVISNENGISYVERGDAGVVLVNISGNSNTVSVTAHAMADGTYTDQITGNTFTVANGKISGEIGATGIAVVYNVPKYDVEITEATGGAVVADKETAKAGETVTVTVTTAEDKEIESVTVTDASGAAVTVTKQNDGTYTFQMPASNVTVAAAFKDKAPEQPVKYNVTVPNGVAADKATAEAGETVTLTVTVPEGKEIESVTVTDASGAAVAVTKENDGTYTFQMPASDVTVVLTLEDSGNTSGGEPGVPMPDNEVEIEEIEGNVTVDNREPNTGDIVKITVTPEEGMKVDKVIVKDECGNEITVTPHENGTYKFVQPVGKVTVKVELKTDYKIVTGDGSNVKHGSDESITVKANGAFHKFTGVKVDGKTVDSQHYIAQEGSTIITFKASFLQTLSVGEHVFTVSYKDDDVNGTFILTETVDEDDETTAPSTGDEDEETTAPSTGDEDEETTAPSTGDEDEETTAPSTGDEDEDTTAPSTGDEDEETTAPSTGDEEEETTAPSTDDEDEETTAPSTDGEEKETTKPSSGNKDDEDTPPTGDESKVVLSTMAMTVSFLGLALLLLDKKRRFVK